MRRPESQVAAEQRALLWQVVTEVIGGVAGRVDGDERDSGALDGLTVAQVRDELGQVGSLAELTGSTNVAEQEDWAEAA